MELVRPLLGYNVYDHKLNEGIHEELNIPALTETLAEATVMDLLIIRNHRLSKRLLNCRPLEKRHWTGKETLETPAFHLRRNRTSEPNL